MRAAWILKREFGFDTRIINFHTLKPIDEAAVTWAAKDTGVVVTAEERQIGALAGRVCGVIRQVLRSMVAPSLRERLGEGSVRPFGSPLGTHPGVQSERGAHCPPSTGTRAHQEVPAIRPRRTSFAGGAPQRNDVDLGRGSAPVQRPDGRSTVMNELILRNRAPCSWSTLLILFCDHPRLYEAAHEVSGQRER
jgi:hypothetical protein